MWTLAKTPSASGVSCRDFLRACFATYQDECENSTKYLRTISSRDTARARNTFARDCFTNRREKKYGEIKEFARAGENTTVVIGRKQREAEVDRTRPIHSASPWSASTRTDTVIRRRVIINLRRARGRRSNAEVGSFIIQWRHVRVYALGHVSTGARHRRCGTQFAFVGAVSSGAARRDEATAAACQTTRL